MTQTTTKTLRVGAYLRVSSEEQVENTSLDDQEARVRDNSTRRGWSVVEVYREEGVTGTTEDRPEWQRLMADARAGRLDVVMGTKWDRLARKALVGLKIAADLEALDVGLVVIDADFDTSTPAGKIMRHMMVGFAQFDRDSLVERMARGQHAMAARGGWPSGGASPYGYRAVGGARHNRLEVHEPEAAVVRQIVAWIINEGLTTGQVCQRLNAAGQLTRKGRLWTHQNLRRMLRERVLLGEITWGNTAKTHRGYRPSGKYGPPVLLRFDPIITEDEFEAVQVALDKRATGTRQPNHVYPLSGRLVSPCGDTYGGVHRKDRDLRQYRCRRARWNATGAPRCDDVRLDAADVEGRVWETVAALLRDPERLLALATEYLGLRGPQLAAERDERAAVARNVARLEKAMSGTVVDLARKGLDADVIAAAVADMQTELDAARTRLSEIEQWQADSAAASQRVRDVWALAEVAQARLDSMTDEQRAETIRLLDVRVTVLDHTNRPALRVEGHLAALPLLCTLAPAGNPAVVGTPPGAPRRR